MLQIENILPKTKDTKLDLFYFHFISDWLAILSNLFIFFKSSKL